MVKSIDQIRKEGLEYSSKIEKLLSETDKIFHLSAIDYLARVNAHVREITALLDAMDRDNRIPDDIPEFYRTLYKKTIEHALR